MYFIKMPKLEEGATEGKVVKWFTEKGENVGKNSELVKIKSGDTTKILKSEKGGILSETYVQEGESSPTESIIGVVDTRNMTKRKKLKGIRKTIARRLGESYRNAVHMTLHKKMNISNVVNFRESLEKDIPLTDFILVGVKEALLEHPELNSNYENNEQKIFEDVNLGYAIDTEKGLLVPVIKNSENLKVPEINKKRKKLLNKVLDGKYSPKDLKGGTFTVTNLGPLGIDEFTPIINPPEVAILGVGRTENESKVNFSLSLDHRVVDGADGARFLNTLQEKLSDPKDLYE